MARPRVLTVAASVLTLTGAVLAATSGAAQAATGGYVALGDSYSSGNGAGSYISDSGSCERSYNAYPELWAKAHSPSSFSFTACSGATTGSVTSGQLGGLNSGTSLVSITVGGNDVGFSSVMTSCVTGSDATCQSAVDSAESKMDSILPGALDSVYTAIRSKAPNAHVVVLDYPHLYDLSVTNCVGLSDTKHRLLNGGADKLDATIQTAAKAHGFTFSDVRDEFNGHELCSGDGWLNSVTIPIGNSYHPTAKGHANGYLPALTGSA